MRRHGLVIVGALALAAFVATSARAHSTPQIRAQEAHARAVRAEVERTGVNLEGAIESALARQQHLLASIHSSIHQLQVEERAREARARAAAEARLRAIAAEKAREEQAAVQQGNTFPTIPPILSTGAGHPEAAHI